MPKQPNYNTLNLMTDSDYTKGIEAIYNFPSMKDYENQGYNDALANPDDNYKTTNIDLIKNDLRILIGKVRTSYENRIRDLEFWIDILSRQGLMDWVERLRNIKEQIHSHCEEIKDIENGLENNQGYIYGKIFDSYQKGFARGVSSLVQAAIQTPLQVQPSEKFF